MPHTHHFPGATKFETAAAALGTVVAADQLMRALQDSRESDDSDAQTHYIKAALAASLAGYGYYELMRDAADNMSYPPAEGIPHHSSHHTGKAGQVLAEALGAYSLGRQMTGHNDNKWLKLLAEGVGATLFAREVNRDSPTA
jgi:hypothetical protein